MRRAIVRSRSARKEELVGARGARCVVANSRAVEIEGLFVVDEEELLVAFCEVAERISSISWRRRREKWRDASVSRSWLSVLVSLGCLPGDKVEEDAVSGLLGHTED